MFRILFNRSCTRTGACGMEGDDLGEHARANHHGEHARAEASFRRRFDQSERGFVSREDLTNPRPSRQFGSRFITASQAVLLSLLFFLGSASELLCALGKFYANVLEQGCSEYKRNSWLAA